MKLGVATSPTLQLSGPIVIWQQSISLTISVFFLLFQNTLIKRIVKHAKEAILLNGAYIVKKTKRELNNVMKINYALNEKPFIYNR